MKRIMQICAFVPVASFGFRMRISVGLEQTWLLVTMAND